MRQEILEKLRQLDEELPLREIHFGVIGHAPPPGALLLPTVRFDIILSGGKKVTLPTPEGIRTVSLSQGDAHYSMPNSWEFHSWDSPHEMLCIVPRVNYLRVSYYHLEEGESGMPPSVYYHTGRPYSDILRNTLEAMNCCARQNNRTAIRPLGRAVISLALAECRMHPHLEEGKAFHTFQKIRTWLENAMQNDIDRAQAARLFEVSPSYISQLFKKMCAMNFHEYLTLCRLNFAKQLLLNTNLTVAQVADQCGFKNHVHFVRRFREKNGIPPGQYREAYLAGLHAGERP